MMATSAIGHHIIATSKVADDMIILSFAVNGNDTGHISMRGEEVVELKTAAVTLFSDTDLTNELIAELTKQGFVLKVDDLIGEHTVDLLASVYDPSAVADDIAVQVIDTLLEVQEGTPVALNAILTQLGHSPRLASPLDAYLPQIPALVLTSPLPDAAELPEVRMTSQPITPPDHRQHELDLMAA